MVVAAVMYRGVPGNVGGFGRFGKRSGREGRGDVPNHYLR